MWKKSHKEIVRLSIRKLGLKRNEFTATLLRYIDEPDRIRRRRKRQRYLPHHAGRQQDIIEYILSARIKFLNGDLKSAGRSLAWALHLIHDHCIEKNRHDELERKIAKINMDKEYRNVQINPLKFERFTDLKTYIYHNVAPKENPEDSILAALNHTVSVICSVVSEKRDPPEDILRKYEECLKLFYAERRKLRRLGLLNFTLSNFAFLFITSIISTLMKADYFSLLMFLGFFIEPIIVLVSFGRENKYEKPLRELENEIAWHSGKYP